MYRTSYIVMIPLLYSVTNFSCLFNKIGHQSYIYTYQQWLREQNLRWEI